MKWVLTLALAAVLPLATPGFAGDSERFSDQYGWLVETDDDWDIFIATVQSEPNPDTTNASPPIVKLQVEEVLRGTLTRGPLTAVWIAPSWFHCGNETAEDREVRQRWRALPLPGPKRGSRWLFGGYPGASGTYVLNHNARYEFDPALVEWVSAAIAKATSGSSQAPP